MRCTRCQEQIEGILEDIHIRDWLKLFHYFEHELEEDEITQKTWESLTDALSSLSPPTYDGSRKATSGRSNSPQGAETRVNGCQS